MFETREIAVENMYQIFPNNGLVFDKIGELAKFSESEDPLEIQINFTVFNLLLKIDHLLIFRRVDNVTEYHFFNAIDIYEYLDYFKEIKEVLQLDNNEIKNKLQLELEKERINISNLKDNDITTVYHTPEYLMAQFKRDVLNLLYVENAALEINDFKTIVNNCCNLMLTLKG